jgi:HEAT repeat protein
VREFQSSSDRSERWLAQRQLERLGPPALVALEAAAREQSLKLEENTYRELLPKLSTTFAQIEKLRQGDPSQRRAAARSLAREAAKDPLSALAVARLDETVKEETDPLVITEALQAAAATKDAALHELALTALAHEDTDVKRRACEYLARCGNERHSQSLAPLVTDRDPLVVRAAVAALGRCGPPRSRAEVHALLAHRDINLQLLAAQTLAKWDDPRGPAALERLAQAQFSATRRQAIAAMSDLASDEFVPALIEALDDRDASVQVAALAALPKVAGDNPLDRLSPRPVDVADRARAWKHWYADRR